MKHGATTQGGAVALNGFILLASGCCNLRKRFETQASPLQSALLRGT